MVLTVPASKAAGAMAVADFNRDGKLDLAVGANVPYSNAPELVVFPGDGVGGFGAALRTSVVASGTGQVSQLAVFDLERIETPDLAFIFTSTVGLYVVRWRRHFLSEKHPGGRPQLTAMADLNGDGKSDLAVSNASGTGVDNVYVLLRNTFANNFDAVHYPAARDLYSINAVDVNADGKVDLAMGTGTTQNVS